ncbi:unnamed protein product [Staurois parvus]|uniref:Uncharacterized protein n=1 Tax=Staurois parvus TaxID=386267 RepID=A0ABN9C333_9NEOB|nr:unnamed protein product [Staurois parvus]
MAQISPKCGKREDVNYNGEKSPLWAGQRHNLLRGSLIIVRGMKMRKLLQEISLLWEGQRHKLLQEMSPLWEGHRYKPLQEISPLWEG